MAQDSLEPAIIDSRAIWNDTGFEVVAGLRYEVAVSGQWHDASHVTGPEGWPGNGVVNWFKFLRRARHFEWAALVGSVDQRKPYIHLMPGTFVAPATGRLYCFANDAPGFYGNNHGSLKLTITKPR